MQKIKVSDQAFVQLVMIAKNVLTAGLDLLFADMDILLLEIKHGHLEKTRFGIGSAQVGH